MTKTESTFEDGMPTLPDHVDLPAGWSWTTLGLVAEFFNGDRSSNYPKQSDFVPYGVPFVNTGHIDPSGRLALNEMNYITRQCFDRLRAGKLRSGDVVYCLRGSTIGKIARVDLNEGAIASSLVIIRPKPNATHDYLYYFLSSPLGQKHVRQHDNGSAQPNLSVQAISQYPIPLPSIGEQDAISATLNSLDDKISQNRRTGAKLEGLARAVFKAWFVDFEPVKAKAAGATAFPGMPSETFAALPNTVQDSPLGPVPQGWEVKPAIDVVAVAIGKTPPRKEPQWFSTDPSNVPWASISDMGSCGVFIRDTSEYLTAESIDLFNVRRIPPGSVLFSFKLTVGRVAITDGEITSNEAIAHFVPSSPDVIGPEYLYCYLSSFDHAQLGSTSSIATATNSKAIKAMPVLVPDVATATSFTSTVRPLFDLIRSLSRESAKLAGLRDYLLPRLLSGRVRVGVTNA